MHMETNINTDTATIETMLRPAPSTPTRHNELFGITTFILNGQGDHAKYWEDEVANGRLFIETNPTDEDGWDACMSVFHVGYFIGDVLLRGADLEAAR